jgi:hypothetical protein
VPGQLENGNFLERLAKNQKLLGGSALFMFFLGLISWFMAMADNGITDGRMKATLSSVILLSMGYPMLLYVGLQKKLKTTEDRLKNLEETIAGIRSAKSGEASEP